jgi:FMN phosphatase YigB (HAD superfamily)
MNCSCRRVRLLLPALRRVHDDFYFWRRVPAGLPEALARARTAGLRIGVVSNSEGRLRSVFERIGLLPYLDVVVDSHLEGVQKPDPEIFRRALARLDLAPDRAIYAGDIPEVDVLGARGAGMEGVLVDAFDDYAGTHWPRVASVAELVDGLLALEPLQAQE